MSTEGRFFLDLSDQIHADVVFLRFVALCWRQAVTQGWFGNSRIPLNKVCIRALELGFSGQTQLCVVVLLLAAVLP